MDSRCCLSGRKCNGELRSSNVEKKRKEDRNEEGKKTGDEEYPLVQEEERRRDVRRVFYLAQSREIK